MNKQKIVLEEKTLNQITLVARKYSEIEEIILFGSRAIGNAKKGSDIDLALVGEEVDQKIVHAFYSYLDEETMIPNLLDVVDFNSISNSELIKHINEFGVTIYNQ